jgi:hypothetical protein
MPKYRITSPDGKTYDVTAPDGATDDEVLAYAQRSFKMAKAPAEAPSKLFGQRLNEEISNIPRQLGLTARLGVEGIGDLANFVSSPIRGAANMVLPSSSQIAPMNFSGAADAVGLPKPRDAVERIVNSTGRSLVGAAAPIAGGAALARNSTGLAQSIGSILGSNPGAQLASAGASGAAGSYTRETGGDDVSQLAASLGAGLAAPLAMAGAQRLGGAASRAASSITGRGQSPQPIQVDVTINNALQDSGLALDQLPADVARGIRADVAAAMKVSDNLSPAAVRRLADYRLTGLTPTRAKLTQDVGDITRQANLAKMGANSTDPAAQALAQIQNQNNRALTAGINKLGAGQAGDQISAAQRIMEPVIARNSRAENMIGGYYGAARGTDGRAALLDPSAFTQSANKALDDSLLGGALPSDIRVLLNRAATGEMPLTVDVAEQFKTRLAEAGRDAMARGDRSTAKAVGLVRGSLENTALQEGQEIGQRAIDAFSAGRIMNREYMRLVENTPILQAVRDGVEPDKIIQDYIIGSGKNASVMNVAALKNVIKNNPDAMSAVREQITGFLKRKALSGAADETGNFSQSAFKNALDSIGDRKLRLFFPQSDIDQLKALSRVASYEQFQPVGSAVNNSNTAGAVGNILERIGGSSLLAKIPFGRQAIGEPLQNISIGMQSGRALDAPQSLIAGARAVQRAPLRPGLMASPLIGQQQETEEERLKRRVRELMNQ